MINKNFYIKNYIYSRHLNKKVEKKLNSKIQIILQKIDYHTKDSKNLLYQLNSNFKFNFKLDDLKKFKKFKKIVIIGMGGSILGSEAIYNFLYHKIDKKVIFLNNINLKEVENLKKKKDYKKTLFIVISKSGNTIETLSNLFYLDILKKNSKNIIIITEKKDNILYNISKKFNLFFIEHKNYIGGRYSVLSEVGMLPAELMGLKINKFKQLNSLIKNKIFLNNLISNVSSILYFIKKKKFNSIIINYDEKLENFLKWYQQLVAESLGKKSKGVLPIISNMPKDNHSVMQLYLDGFKNNFYTFFYVKENASEKINNLKLFSKYKFLKNKNLDNIIYAQKRATEKVFNKKKIPFRSFEINNRDEEVLGELFSFFILETILLGKAMKLNPFDQPEVELIKKETKKILV